MRLHGAKGECVLSTGGFATIYGGGLAKNTDRVNLGIIIDALHIVKPSFIGQPDGNQSRQINFQCPAGILAGHHETVLWQGDVLSAVATFEVVP